MVLLSMLLTILLLLHHAGSLPTTVPPITITAYYWARGVTSLYFQSTYGSEADANA